MHIWFILIENSFFRLFLLFVLLFSSINVGKCKVTCTYELNFFDYACRLNNQVINSINDTLEIDGTHLAGFGDQNVTALRTSSSVIKIFPSQFPLKFRNMRGVFLENVSFETFGESFENCENLRTISFLQNPIKFIPSGIFNNCTNVTSLNFVGTEISQVHELAFENLEELKRLSLKGGKLFDLEQNVFENLSKLETLDLSENIIENLPGEIFWPLTELLTLDISNNNISIINQDCFRNNAKLSSLNLDGNRLQFLNEEESSTIFENLISLKVLSMRNNNIFRLPAFKGLENLEKLDLSSNILTETRPHSYEVLTNLNHLILNDNRIVLSYGFLMFSKKLKTLSLQNNQIVKIDDHAFEELGNLGTLDLSYNNLTKLEAKTFAGLNMLMELDLSFNQIEEIDRNMFQSICRLYVLNMKGNKCADVNILIVNQKLTQVDEELAKCFNSSNNSKTRWFLLSAALLLLIVNQVL